jgi:hypothetical protein
MEQNKARTDVAESSWNINEMAPMPEVQFIQQEIETTAPEVALINRYVSGIGGFLFFGVGKVTETRFYCGGECTVGFKNIEATRKNEKGELLNADDTFIVYIGHQLFGKVTYTLNLKYYKTFEGSAGLKLGYFFTNRLLAFVKLGSSLHRNTYKELNIDTASTLDGQRYDDETFPHQWEKHYLASVTPLQYKSPKYTQYYSSLNLGLGCNFFLTRKAFICLGYEYKMAISSDICSKLDTSIEDDVYKAYGLRYQDREHCISLGFGFYV